MLQVTSPVVHEMQSVVLLTVLAIWQAVQLARSVMPQDELVMQQVTSPVVHAMLSVVRLTVLATWQVVLLVQLVMQRVTSPVVREMRLAVLQRQLAMLAPTYPLVEAVSSNGCCHY